MEVPFACSIFCHHWILIEGAPVMGIYVTQEWLLSDMCSFHLFHLFLMLFIHAYVLFFVEEAFFCLFLLLL